MYISEGKSDANPGLATADLWHVMLQMLWDLRIPLRASVTVNRTVDGASLEDGMLCPPTVQCLARMPWRVKTTGRSHIHGEAQRPELNSFQQQILSSVAVSCG